MNEKLKDDLLIGAEAIAGELGLTQRQIFYAAETKKLPIFRLGNKLAARRSSLQKRIDQLESEAA